MYRISWKGRANMKYNGGTILASVTMITIVSLASLLDANNFLDDCSGNILKNSTTGTYHVTYAWFKLGRLYSFCTQVCYNIFVCRKVHNCIIGVLMFVLKILQ